MIYLLWRSSIITRSRNWSQTSGSPLNKKNSSKTANKKDQPLLLMIKLLTYITQHG